MSYTFNYWGMTVLFTWWNTTIQAPNLNFLFVLFFSTSYISKQKQLRCKKGGQELKQALLKKMWNQMGGQCLLVLIGLKVLVMMNSLQNIVISDAQGLLMLMGSNFLIKVTRLQKQKYVLHTFLVCFSSLHCAYHFWYVIHTS